MATNPAFKAQTEESGAESTRAESLVTKLGERLAATANARNVYGEPVTAHNRTIIPVAKVGYGVGAGSGRRTGQDGGTGGGGGVGARPLGYIEITNEGTRYVAFTTPKKIIGAAVAAFAAGLLLGSVRR